MTLQENIAKLVRYCGQYQSHGFMMDERNTDVDFNVQLPEEQEIHNLIAKLRIILFTGEAGDGKSRIMRNLKDLFIENGFCEPYTDFSALTENDKKVLIEKFRRIIDGGQEEKLVISANVGVFTQAVIRYDIDLMKELTLEREDVYICNFENRNLAENGEVFERIVRSFLTDGREEGEYLCCEDISCPCYMNCCYKQNIQKILSSSGLEAVRTICNAIHLTGGHVTFRELLSLLSYMVTFGQNCEERRTYIANNGNIEKVMYYNVFDRNGDALLSKVSQMDPALKKGEYPENVITKEQYVSYRRKLFFEEKQDCYSMLNVDYLVEFYHVLEYMNKPPYHYDTVQDKNPTLQSLKRGINKMSSQGKSDIGLVVTDTPLILGNHIRTEFMVMQDMSMIWHRYDVQIGRNNHNSTKFWNKFYLSYMVKKGEDRKLISLLIDYRQFRYLMLCSEDYFMNRSELTVEEYAVNTFYRKILQEKEQAYDSIVIRFDDKTEDKCDFSLTVHESEDIFSGEKRQTIRIRRED